MKKLLVLLLSLTLSGVVFGKDVAIYRNPEIKLEVIITNEPCSDAVISALAAMVKETPEFVRKELPELVSARAFFHSTGLKVNACVMPPDEDGDLWIYDERGQQGWLNMKHITPGT